MSGGCADAHVRTCCNVGWCTGDRRRPRCRLPLPPCLRQSREAGHTAIRDAAAVVAALVAWCVRGSRSSRPRSLCPVQHAQRSVWRGRGRNPSETGAADQTAFFRCRLADFVPLDWSLRLSQKYRYSISFHFRRPRKRASDVTAGRLMPRSIPTTRPDGTNSGGLTSTTTCSHQPDGRRNRSAVAKPSARSSHLWA